MDSRIRPPLSRTTTLSTGLPLPLPLLTRPSSVLRILVVVGEGPLNPTLRFRLSTRSTGVTSIEGIFATLLVVVVAEDGDGVVVHSFFASSASLSEDRLSEEEKNYSERRVISQSGLNTVYHHKRGERCQHIPLDRPRPIPHKKKYANL